MAELRNTFIRNLKYYRKQKGVRQLDLALEIGKSSNYINSIENGKYFPSPETIEEIAHFLGIEPIRLFDSEISPASSAPSATLPDLKAIESQLQEIISNDIRKVFSEIGEDEG
ncbi:MAG: helix-turn-helix transcriptional regulator [Treponema sp.]|uniref:helix-turn-helix domain-containing protein n=1 Tax=Treponema sp. TaxID=166 RepID=UPI0025E0D51C|nr:helix-turn-helix transcriptional regulator [Treponema sp.]MBQ8680767.1 helix-turn-helix transcriptional regulator [Treponema sp.]